MWIRVLTMAMTTTLCLAVFGLALLFMAASWTEGLRGLVLTYGLWMTLGVFALLVLTVFMRYHAGLMLLKRGEHEEALRYSRPRVTANVTVGKNEAAINRYVAAEALRRMGSPVAALAQLDIRAAAPRNQTLKQMLKIARASALIATGEIQRGQDLLSSMEGALKSREAKQAHAHATALLDENTSI